jgi:ech hydrogenase subunit D
MLKHTIEITKDNLLHEVAARLPQGFRFATITCIDLGDAFDLIYHFDKDYQLFNIRLRLGKDEELPSISGVFMAAVIVENELKDLFGIPVKGLIIDYGGRLLLSEGAPVAPQRKPTPAKAEPVAGAAAAASPAASPAVTAKSAPEQKTKQKAEGEKHV